MITYEHDPDVVRWGLHLLEGDLFQNSGYCGAVTQHDTSYYTEQYVREDHYDTKHSSVENDEIIAHALQEELSQLAVAEASGTSNAAGEEQLQASILAQDWLGPSMGNYSSGHESGQDETDDMGPSSSCSSPEEKSYNGDDWSNPLEITDESMLDGEVGKRLNQMVPIPHVPKINGEIPSIDEATSDHQRLLDRLQLYDLVELKVQGDGNCQFRALSDQFYRTTEHHKFVRQQIVDQLKSHPDIYEGYVPMAYSDYLKKMSKSGEWGDHVTLQAAADSYGIKIFVITSFKDTCYIEILPNIQKSKRVIFLSFWAEVHYNSIYPEGDMPAFETKRKKRWWIFGN
ncbi:OVARIAN TUMOR DOMAIN-containing deubiquitinating enzyme 12-like [Macadamia integrifolia]|uniref:OVARIAN TUMOR DOMAIN-containing deubiquitinating enzyme 12-like n=1 Tax=Macadamia integrifolia TaxID=60698 RepID=UPI001C52E142|nr:OVARIAN TUMOR DOMAIN-containing deubiquitinating enzyme 12-like [Macadamia integrifolia]XP_042475938.1 OVARIAN TUMOR DOMAIN-containing deubiquitinating enzyme 12-like [Macadamia integrifolia]XP_042475939.1 OVARIAN TUMOR DOMAIN-containing deubiquitinating enzyme 12-like [Macadamia integrifolia]